MGAEKRRSKKFSKEIYQHGENDADDYHCGNWEIKMKVVSFNANIAGQLTKPVQFIVKEIDQYANDNDHHACNDEPFAGLRIHDTTTFINQL